MQAEQETSFRDWHERRSGTMENGFRDGHWGTKSNASYSTLREGATDKKATIEFDTAWSPPEPIIIELSKQFPKLAFSLKYWEGGAGYRGILRVKGGKILQNFTYDYKGQRGG